MTISLAYNKVPENLIFGLKQGSGEIDRFILSLLESELEVDFGCTKSFNECGSSCRAAFLDR